MCSFPESQTFLLLLGNSFDDQYDFDEDDDTSLFWHHKLGNRGWGLPVVKGGGGAGNGQARGREKTCENMFLYKPKFFFRVKKMYLVMEHIKDMDRGITYKKAIT